MKLTRNWLEDYVDIPINTEDLCHQLTMAGLEVDNISLVDNDELIDIDLTPNRSDCLSVNGVARELRSIDKKYKRKVLNKILEFKEKNLFIRGLRAWVGFKQTGVEYDRPKRNAGTEKFNLFSSFFFGLDGLISFSIIPLRIILLTGLFMSFISILFSFFIFIVKLLSILSIIPSDALLLMPKGLTITSILFLISTSFIILALGIIGEYISKIYLEVKNRPHYLIKEIIE